MNNSKLPFTRKALASTLLAASAWYIAPTMAQTLVLEEVIVTAQKRSESVQDIAATVNVLTGDTTDKFKAFTFSDIQALTAGINMATPNARNSTISMRGIGTDPEAGTAGAVDVYWNGMTVRQDVAFNQLYDLERMEILRGPQGTLQGRTSPAGAINIITKKPDMSEATGYVQTSASDDEGMNGQVAYSMPLIEDVLAVRVAALYDTNFSNNVTNLVSGLDDAENETKSGRMSVAWSPLDTLSADLSWQYQDRNTEDPKAVQGTDSLGVRPTLEDDDLKAMAKFDDYGNFNFNIVNLTLGWEVMDHEVTSITGYNDSTKKGGNENDRANYVTNPLAATHQLTNTEVESWSQELRIASIDNEFWDYMAGIYYQDQNTETSFLSNTTVRQLAGSSFTTNGAIPVNANETGLFTFNQFYLTDTIQLDAGLRWANYDRKRSADVYYGEATYAGGPFTLAQIDAIVGNSGRFPISAVSPENQESDDDAVTGSLALRYEWTEEVSVYVSYNRGYRPGGISIIPDPDVAFLPGGEDTLLYDEETSDAIELGFKSRLLDGAATLNAALYYQKFDGYFGFVRGVQVLNDVNQPADISGGLVFNGDANIWGTEIEGEILLSEQWSFGGAISYNKGEWDGASAPCNEREPGEALGYCDIDGDAVGGEPEWSASLNSEYFIPMMDTMEWYVRGLVKYTDDRLNTDASAGTGAVLAEFDAYNTVNLFSGVRSTDGVWDVNVWAKNLFDEDAITYQTGSDQYDLEASGGSYTQANILKERTIGITGRYNF